MKRDRWTDRLIGTIEGIVWYLTLWFVAGLNTKSWRFWLTFGVLVITGAVFDYIRARRLR